MRELLEEKKNEKEILSLSETARFLDVSKSYLYKLTSSRAIPFYCPTGKKLYFNRKELINWIFRNKRAESEDIERQAVNNMISKN